MSQFYTLYGSHTKEDREFPGAGNNEVYLIFNLPSVCLFQPTPTGLGVIGCCSSDLFHIADC